MVDNHKAADVGLKRSRVVAQADDRIVGRDVRVIARERQREAVTELRAPLVVDVEAVPILLIACHRLTVAACERVGNGVIVALCGLTNGKSEVYIRVFEVVERENQLVEVLDALDVGSGKRLDEHVRRRSVTHVYGRVESHAVAVGKAHHYARGLCEAVGAVGRAALAARHDVSRVVDAERHFVHIRLAVDRGGVDNRVNAAHVERNFLCGGRRAVGLYHDGRCGHGGIAARQSALGHDEFRTERLDILHCGIGPRRHRIGRLFRVAAHDSRRTARGDCSSQHSARNDGFPFFIHTLSSCRYE